MNYTKEDYYTEITCEEYWDFVSYKQIGFNLRDTNRLKTLSNKIEVYNYIRFNNNIDIFECDDEWFLVANYNTFGYYKCDQYDGLIYCLKDKRFI